MKELQDAIKIVNALKLSANEKDKASFDELEKALIESDKVVDNDKASLVDLNKKFNTLQSDYIDVVKNGVVTTKIEEQKKQEEKPKSMEELFDELEKKNKKEV